MKINHPYFIIIALLHYLEMAKLATGDVNQLMKRLQEFINRHLILI